MGPVPGGSMDRIVISPPSSATPSCKSTAPVSPAQAPLPGHHGFQACLAGGAPSGAAGRYYLRLDEDGWLYPAVVLDLFNREVVGWSIKPRMSADIVIDALTMAGFHRKPAPEPIHHSDRGSQYASQALQSKLAEYGMICSMSRKGNCWDNASTESFFNSLLETNRYRYASRRWRTAIISIKRSLSDIR